MNEDGINFLNGDSLADVSGGAFGNVSLNGNVQGGVEFTDNQQIITTHNEHNVFKIGDIGSGNKVGDIGSGNKGTIGATAEVTADLTVGYKGGTTYPTQ